MREKRRVLPLCDPIPLLLCSANTRKKLFSPSALTANRSDWQIAPSLFDAIQRSPCCSRSAFHLLWHHPGDRKTLSFTTQENHFRPFRYLHCTRANSVSTLAALFVLSSTRSRPSPACSDIVTSVTQDRAEPIKASSSRGAFESREIYALVVVSSSIYLCYDLFVRLARQTSKPRERFVFPRTNERTGLVEERVKFVIFFAR